MVVFGASRFLPIVPLTCENTLPQFLVSSGCFGSLAPHTRPTRGGAEGLLCN